MRIERTRYKFDQTKNILVEMKEVIRDKTKEDKVKESKNCILECSRLER